MYFSDTSAQDDDELALLCPTYQWLTSSIRGYVRHVKVHYPTGKQIKCPQPGCHITLTNRDNFALYLKAHK